MSTTKNTEPQAAVKPAAKSEPAPVLGSAAASSDPVVHQLLAELEIHDRNGDKAAADVLLDRLANLGYGL